MNVKSTEVETVGRPSTLASMERFWSTPGMDIREALYTTRAMRRVTPDPIPEDVQMRILDATIRAPSGGNSQQWRFMLVDDADTQAKWYYRVKREWLKAEAEERPFRNPVEPRTLSWHS